MWEGGIRVYSGHTAKEQKIRKGPEGKVKDCQETSQGLETTKIQQNPEQPSKH